MAIFGERSGDQKEVTITEEQIFDILANERRRLVVRALQQTDGEAELGWLAERVAAWENGDRITEVGSDARKSAYTGLQQSHLPKMDRVGLVDFDERAGTVEPTAATREVDLYLEVVRRGEIPWHGYYLGLGAVGASLWAALWVDAAPFSALPDLAWVAFLVAALLVSAGAHTYYAQRRRVSWIGDGGVGRER